MSPRHWLARRKSPRARKVGPRKLRFDALEAREVPAAPVLDPIPDQVLTSTQPVKMIPVTAADPDGDAVTYSARAAGTEAYFLATNLGLKPQSARRVNWGGQGEKWLRGTAGWYFVIPSGSFHEWDGTARQATGRQLATLPPAYFQAPDLLTRPRDAGLATVLDRRFGLTPAVSPAANTLGLGEKWMTGTGGARFFITPDGELYRAAGRPLGTTRTLVAQLDPAHAADLRRLTSAAGQRPTVSTLGNVVRVAHATGAADGFLVQVTASDGSAVNRQTFAVEAVGGAAPVVPDGGPQVLGVGEQSLSFNLGATDPDGDALTYTAQAAGSEAYFLATELGLRPSNRATNWGGEGERWFLSQSGDWYFLKPGGDFHQWDGTNRAATGPQLATLPPVYFHSPDLLLRPSPQDLAYVLDQRLGLTPAGSPAPGSLGLEEKWLAGRDGTRFFITPAGGFYRQTGGTTTWLGDLGAGYHKTPDRLYAAPRDRFAAEVAADGTLTVTTKPNFLGRFAVRVTASDGVNTTSRVVPVAQSDYVSEAAPRVAGAAATRNRAVTVSFTQPMGNSALNPANYQVTQAGGDTGVAFLGVTAARFLSADRTAVELTTLSQNDVMYTLAVVNVRDLGGTPLAAATDGIDPTRATFAGRPPTLADLADSDNDGLLDHEEQHGWEVRVQTLSGTTVSRWVTSDPAEADSDADGLADAHEANLRLDPRDRDTDDDQLVDFAEFNEIYSDAASQDTDGDTLDDSLEFTFFRSSPVEPDTDGDQLPDSQEVVLGNRNPRIADVPKPGIAVGTVDLRLDVRFAATSAGGTRALESKSVSSTLTQSERTEYATSDSASNELATKAAYEQGWHASTGEAGVGAEGKFSVEAGYTGQWTSSFTETSTEETSEALTESLQTDAETTLEETITREVVGASVKVGLNLRSQSNIAFTIRNLQVTAFVQDPAQAGRLVPVATLLPDAGVPNEFTLGPLVPERGPFVFVSDQVFPALVQDLMANPRGLEFKVANYDLVDERGRNFAFASQEINDRTAPLVIDFGFGDADGGRGVSTERYRVATSSGRVAVDTNGDGTVGAGDRPVVFDPTSGKAVGITVGEALQNILGLAHYDEDQTPTDSLSPLERDGSYSTKVVNGVERLWRVREATRASSGGLRRWAVFTADGIDRPTDFSDLVLRAETGLTLKFIQDQDNDTIEAAQEYMLGSSDEQVDTDGDGLTDAFEFYGRGPDPEVPADPQNPEAPRPTATWVVDVPGRTRALGFSSPARPDSDLDGMSDADEFMWKAPGDHDGNPNTPPVPVRFSLDALRPDTDGDRVTDFAETDGYDITLRFPEVGGPATINRRTDPLDRDSDGDTLADGSEQAFGTDPLHDDEDLVLDNDGDGLVNFLEDFGWLVTTYGVSTSPNAPGVATTKPYESNRNDPDSDDDGLNDREEQFLGTDPTSADTDQDGVADASEVTVVNNPDGTRTVTLRYDPRDADLDNDKRSDGAELNTPILVSVFGETPYNVFSDPAQADADNDTLVDGDERTAGTDPTEFDTDGDNPGIGDRREQQLGTNPLRADQKVTVTVTQIQLFGGEATDGEGGSNDSLEVYGTIKLGRLDDLDTIFILTPAVNVFRLGTTFSINVSRTYILDRGDALELQNSGLFDEDPGIEEDDPFQDASKVFNFPLEDETGSLSSPGNGSNLVTSYRVEVNF